MLAEVEIARARVAEVRAALRSPTAEEIDACLPLLDDAIVRLQSVPAAPDDPEFAGEVEALKFELSVVRRMIDGGAAFYQGWANVLATTVAGYTPEGEPAVLTAPGSVCVQG
jgi:hypothetical protein